VWGRDGGGSGAGSTLAHTATARVVLEMLIHRHGVMRLLDAPCGSAHWWPPLLERLRWFRPGFEYVGVDVVESKIAENKAKFAVDFPPPQATFFAADLAQAALPADQRFDLSLCRDALQHLPLALAVAALENVARSGADFALLGSYAVSGWNCEMRQPGFFSWVNLLKAPFLLPAPLEAFDEGFEAKRLLLFDVKRQLAGLDFEAMRARAALHSSSEAYVAAVDLQSPCGNLPE
jgi:SAM-dependent methyltransferase